MVMRHECCPWLAKENGEVKTAKNTINTPCPKQIKWK
jgi:hypothetical protein